MANLLSTLAMSLGKSFKGEMTIVQVCRIMEWSPMTVSVSILVVPLWTHSTQSQNTNLTVVITAFDTEHCIELRRIVALPTTQLPLQPWLIAIIPFNF